MDVWRLSGASLRFVWMALADESEMPITKGQARRKVREWIDKPEHKIEPGSKADKASVEDRLDDPEKQDKGEG